MLRPSLLVAVSFLALGACQPASEATEDLVAETPPPMPEDVAVEVEPAAVETVAAEADVVEVVEDEAHDHEDEHDHGTEDEHDHEDHDDHADHDHETHDHEDHDDHDHAGGEAHVHGLSELAVSLEGSQVSISLEGALANFGLDETLRTIEDPAAYTDTVIALEGGDCTRESASASIRPVGDHGNMMIDMVYSCAAMDDLEALVVTGFETFAGFEEVKAVVLTETGQTASTLTAGTTRVDLK